MIKLRKLTKLIYKPISITIIMHIIVLLNIDGILYLDYLLLIAVKLFL